jgi:hypothetical protein
MSKFEDTIPSRPSRNPEALTARAHLPGLDIEIVHRSLPSEDAEQISITLTAVPSFEAFSRYFEAINPFAICARAVQLAWFPWVEAARAVSPNLLVSSLPERSRSGSGDRQQD